MRRQEYSSVAVPNVISANPRLGDRLTVGVQDAPLNGAQGPQSENEIVGLLILSQRDRCSRAWHSPVARFAKYEFVTAGR